MDSIPTSTLTSDRKKQINVFIGRFRGQKVQKTEGPERTELLSQGFALKDEQLTLFQTCCE